MRPAPDQMLTYPSLCNDRVFHSGGATDSSSPVYVDIQLCNTDGYEFPVILLMAAMIGFLTHFASFFALLRLSRS